MVVVKKSMGGGAPSLDILAARVKILEVEYQPEEKEVEGKNGKTFTSDPNVNCKLKVLKNFVEPGVDEGATFYDRFKLKRDKDGDWTFAKYSKLGKLIVLRYGEEWFEDDNAEFDENHFVDFDFNCQLQPKEDPKGNPLDGTSINWKSMRPVGVAEEAESPAADDATTDVEREAEEDIPF